MKTILKKRVNFILKINVVKDMNELVPEGERSEFVSQAIEEKLTQLSREKSAELLADLREKLKHKTTNSKIYKDIRYGRK